MKRILAFLLLLTLCFDGSFAKQRPNILFIMADDHCDRAIGAYQGRLASLDPTPNLDRLAAKGMLFQNVFCTNSICTPSRATIMTGQYSHTNKAYDLYTGLPEEKHYLTNAMRAAGYATAVVGKWHLHHSPNDVDYFAVIAGQGRYMDPVMHVSEGGKKRKIRFDSTLDKVVEVIDTKGHSSDVLTDISLDWLENKRDKDKPFFLMHHFKAPHGMFEYADRYNNYLQDVEIPEPTNLYNQPGKYFGSLATRGVNDDLVGVIGSTISPQANKRNLTNYYQRKYPEIMKKEGMTNRELTHLSYQFYLKEYLRCVKGIDDNLQRLIDYLEDNDLMDNTIVVYTSDQGMILGEHDYMDKRWMYEESIRMPLIVYYPPMIKAATSNDWLINNTDYAPTLLELAGVDKPEYMQGESFVNALKGKKEPKDWRKATYYRYWMHMAHKHNNPAHFGIRTKTHKLIFYYGSDYTDVHGGTKVEGKGGNRYWEDTPVAWELYDLEKDPKEMVNQYNNPSYAQVVQALKAELFTLREDIGDTDEAFPKLKKIIEDNWDK